MSFIWLIRAIIVKIIFFRWSIKAYSFFMTLRNISNCNWPTLQNKSLVYTPAHRSDQIILLDRNNTTLMCTTDLLHFVLFQTFYEWMYFPDICFNSTLPILYDFLFHVFLCAVTDGIHWQIEQVYRFTY